MGIKGMAREGCMDWRKSIFKPVAIIYGAGVLLWIATILLNDIDKGLGWDIIKDTGPVQSLTVIILIAAALICAYLTHRYKGNRITFALMSYIMIFYAAREADLHNFEKYSVGPTNIKFYSLPDVPGWEKAVCGIVFISLILSILVFLARVVGPFFSGLKKRELWPFFALFWLATLIGSQISDKSFLNEIFVGQALEEIAELVAAILIFPILRNFPRCEK